MDEDQLNVRPAKPPHGGTSEDLYRLTDDLDFIKTQLAQLPTRMELARTRLRIIFCTSVIVILWFEVSWRQCQ